MPGQDHTEAEPSHAARINEFDKLRGPRMTQRDGGNSHDNSSAVPGYTTSTRPPAITARCSAAGSNERFRIGSTNAELMLAPGSARRPASTAATPISDW